MKKILMIFVLLSGNSYAESSFKVYGMGGTGHSAGLSYGGGMTYTWNTIPQENKKLIHVVDLNMFLLGVQDFEHKKYFNITDPGFQLNFFLTYGLGFKTKNNILISFDVIGMGINVTARDNIFPGDPGGSTYTKIGTLFNTLGVQLTMPNGFYFAWRNTFTGFNWRSTEVYREITGIADAGEFKTLLIFGYSFGLNR